MHTNYEEAKTVWKEERKGEKGEYTITSHKVF